MNNLVRHLLAFTVAALLMGGASPARSADGPTPSQSVLSEPATRIAARDGKIAPYQARFGRSRPVIAVIGENSGTELTDFVIPYGVLAASGVAEMVPVSTQAGPMTMRPALRIQPEATTSQFDARYPQGADYVIVPAVVKHDDPTLLAWIAEQGAKGSTIVSICDGALVVASSGLMDGRRATAHWATYGLRTKAYPTTNWVKNTRYVADGKIVSSAGISAAMPVSIALVEAIAGYDRAATVAQGLGVTDWSQRHDSDIFLPRFGVNLMAYIRTTYSNRMLHAKQSIGVPMEPGVDEIALAFTADAYSRTGRSRAYSLSTANAAVQTRHGLRVLPDRVIGGDRAVDRTLAPFDATPSARVLDQALAGIARLYGRSTAYGVALSFEYPGFVR